MSGLGGRNVYALIPARAGSKRLPNKNMLPFDGKPMLSWTALAARNAGLFNRVFISSDHPGALELAPQLGAEALSRQTDLAGDKASLIEVAQDFLAAHPECEQLCMLLPNCPLRTEVDIVSTHAHFQASGAPAVLSVVDFGWTPPFRALVQDDEGLQFVMPEWRTQKSQAYPHVTCPTGAVYWARPEALLGSDSLYVPGLLGFEIPWNRGIDIDTATDFRLAEAMRHCQNTGFDLELAPSN